MSSIYKGNKRLFRCDEFPVELRKTHILNDNDFCKEEWDRWPERARPYCNQTHENVLPNVTFVHENDQQPLCTVYLGNGVNDGLEKCTQFINVLNGDWAKSTGISNPSNYYKACF